MLSFSGLDSAIEIFQLNTFTKAGANKGAMSFLQVLQGCLNVTGNDGTLAFWVANVCADGNGGMPLKFEGVIIIFEL